MSSIPNPVSQPQRPPGVPASVRQTTDEVRQSLHQHLKKTASFIKFMDGLVLLFGWIAAMLLIWLAACAVDHWLWPLASWGRWLFWASGVAAAVWWLGWRLLPLIVRRINPVYAAKRIEHLVPEFKNGLISWLELESLPAHGVPRGVMSALAYRAARFIGGQDPSATVDTSPLIKIIGGVLLLSTGLVLYTMLSPKSVFLTGQRILIPWSSLAPPTRVHILEVKPGAIELTQGKPLEVEVAVKGLRRDEKVVVRCSTLDKQFQNQRTPLTATTEGFRYAGRVVTESQGIHQPLDYWIEAGDASSGPYRVQISPLPSVVLQSIELEYPPYTQLAPRTLSGESVEAVEGTRVTIHAQSNQPLSRGRLEINPTLDETGELVKAEAFVDMQLEQRVVQARLTLQLDDAHNNPTKVEYRIRGFNERGDSNPRPITHALSVLADVPPEVTLVGPESRLLRVRANARINLEVRASDPDFGLSRLSLKPSRNGVPAPDITLLQTDAARGRQVKTYAIDLSQSRATVGEKFEVVAVAEDNRHDPVSQQLAPNVTRSQPLVLQIVGPDETPDPLPNPPPSSDTPSPNGEQSGSQQNPQSQQQDSLGSNGNNSGEASNGAGESQSAGEEPSSNGSKKGEESSGAGEQQPSGAGSSSGGSKSGEESSGAGEQQPNGAGSSSSDSNSENSQPQSNSGQSSSENSSQKNGKNASNSESQGKGDNNTGASGSESTSQSSRGGQESTSSSGGQPSSDAEAFERVSDYLKSQQPQSSPTENGANDIPKPQSQSGETQPGDRSAEGAQSPSSDAQGSSADSTQPSNPDPASSTTQKPSPPESESSGKDPSDNESAGKESARKEATGKDSTGKESAGKESAGKEAAGKEAAGKEAAGKEAAGKEAAGKEAAGKEAASSEESGSEGSQSEGSSSPDSSTPSSSTGSGSSSTPPGGSGTGTRGGEGGGSSQRDATNGELADKTTQMVLDYLNRQKDQPDPDLLRKMDWTAQDLNRFVERWNQARDLADSRNPADRKKWQELLEQLDLSPAERRVRQGSDLNDNFQQMRDSGGRMRVPTSLQKQFEAYRNAIEQAR